MVYRSIPFLSLIFSLLLLSGGAHGRQHSRQEKEAPSLRTNAERLARGLPPLEPRKLFSPTNAPRAVPSPAIPGTVVIGSISVRNKQNGNLLGYLKGGSITSGAPQVVWAFTVPTDWKSPLNLISNSDNRALEAYQYTSANLKPGSSENVLFIASTRRTLPYSPPYVVPGTSPQIYVETCVWFIDRVTSAVTARWVNPDGSTYPNEFVSSGGRLYLTADASAKIGSNTPTPVTLVWN